MARDAHLLWSPSPKEREIAECRQFGPFYEKVVTAEGTSRESVRPFLWTRIKSGDGMVSHDEYLWPLYACERRDGNVSWRFLCFFGMNRQPSGSNSQDRTWLIPFWFSGTAKTGDSYAALWPIYGTIREMWWDRIDFTLFPLWVTWDRADNHTWSVLWPFVMHQTGPERDAWRIFPFWGHTVADGKFESRYVMWPFWIQNRHDDINPGHDWMLWPFAGHVDRELENQWLVLPPFFSFSHGKGSQSAYRRINCPWPIFGIWDSKDSHNRRFFPFWSRRWLSNGHAENEWILWPFWNRRRVQLSKFSKDEWTLFPLFHHSVQKNIDPKTKEETLSEDFFRFWPLYSNRKDPEHRLTKVPDFSISKRTGALERNLLGMFTLYTRGEQTDPERIDHQALWGMFRYGYGTAYRTSRVWPLWDSVESDGQWRWRILGGLLGRSGSGDKSNWRFLWFFGGDAEEKEVRPTTEKEVAEQ